MSSTGSEIAGPQALPLSGLVNYQEGTVVNRVILQRDKGNVTMFSFDEGQGLNEHTSPFDAPMHVIAEVTVADKEIALKPGQILLFTGRKSHAAKAVMRFKMMLMIIRS